MDSETQELYDRFFALTEAQRLELLDAIWTGIAHPTPKKDDQHAIYEIDQPNCPMCGK